MENVNPQDSNWIKYFLLSVRQRSAFPAYKPFYFNRWFNWSCRSEDCSTFFWIASCWYWRCVVIIAIFLKLSSECKMASSCRTMFRAAWPSSSELREPFSTCLVSAITSVPQVFTFSVRSPFTDWPNRACESGVPVAITSTSERLSLDNGEELGPKGIKAEGSEVASLPPWEKEGTHAPSGGWLYLTLN